VTHFTSRGIYDNLNSVKAIALAYLFLCMILFTASAVASDTNQFDRAINAITQSLPPGWTIAERKSDEIPWGHHWNENYTGPKGVLIIAKGVRPVNAEFEDPTGKRWAVHVATESLHIWLMPSNYSDSPFAWMSIERPVQPTIIVNHGPIKVYAQPTSLLLSQKDFDKILSNTNGVSWPDSPANNPKLLTWKDWRLKLREAIKKEFANE
jgi:hypothetical protein